MVNNVRTAFRKLTNVVRHQLEDNIRLLNGQDSSSSVLVNKKEIRVVGLRRSGNHALMNWIRKQCSSNIIYINNVHIYANPYREVYEDQLDKAKDSSLIGWRTDDIDFWRRESRGQFSKKDYLLYSYEDQPIDRLADKRFERKHDLYLGKSEMRYDLILMRDPFNLFASRLRASQRKNDNSHYLDFMKVKSSKVSLARLWIDYAKEYLNETNYLSNMKIPVNYNMWVLDKTYRQNIAESLGLDFSDTGFDEVMTNGGGSSFDGVSLSGKASEMMIFERYSHFLGNPKFEDLLRDPLLLEYSKRLFGTIPGTELFYE